MDPSETLDTQEHGTLGIQKLVLEIIKPALEIQWIQELETTKLLVVERPQEDQLLLASQGTEDCLRMHGTLDEYQKQGAW